MKSQSAAAPYIATQVKTADQGKLILMLYDAAIKCLERGKIKIKEKKFEDKHKLLNNAQETIFELMEGLDLEAGEIAKQLFRIYNYMVRRIIAGDVSCDTGPVEEVIRLLKDLRDSWRQILEKPISGGNAPKSDPMNVKLSIRT